MIDPIVVAVVTLGFIALILSIGLGFAGKKFASNEDPAVEKVFAALPQNNCGACGYPSCMQFAKALVEKTAGCHHCGGESSEHAVEPMHCRLGGPKVAEEISKILGVQIVTKEELVVSVICKRGSHDKFIYQGVQTCHAASIVSQGPKSCMHSCIGLGDCIAACQFGALSIMNGFIVVDKEKCTGCGRCVNQCPKKVLVLSKRTNPVSVRCHAHECPRNVFRNCRTGCISCSICVRKCPKKAISIVDNLATIDYKSCIACGLCVKVCPRNVIEKS